MRTLFALLLTIGTLTTVCAQIEYPEEGCMIRYQYDASGNRISRDWFCWGKEVKSRAVDSTALAAATDAVLADIHMNAFPNPASELVTVTFTKAVPSGMLEVLDAAGRSVLSQRVAGSTAVLKLGSLEQGNYWLAFTLEDERIVTGLVIDGARH